LLSDEDINEEKDDLEQEEESYQEFILAVDELESVLSYRGTNEQTYNLQSNIKKLDARSLDSAFTELDEMNQLNVTGKKRLKISEETEISYPVYNSSDLKEQVENLDRISLCLKNKQKVRYVSKGINKMTKLKIFQMLAEELKKLSRISGLHINDIHMMFLEVSCDLNVLKKVLKNEQAHKNKQWSELEDLAVQCESNSMEYLAICQQKGVEEVKKRRLFLEKE
jgi:hypothetical protein